MMLALAQCRACGRSSRTVRFASKRLCTDCASSRKAERAERIASRGPRMVVNNEPDPRSNPKHLAWVRKFPCAVCGPTCEGPIEAHHVRENTGAGVGMKPGDEWAVPLCARHHAELHQSGALTFGEVHNINLRALAVRLASSSPHARKGTAA